MVRTCRPLSLRLDELNDRTVPSVTSAFEDGTLTVRGLTGVTPSR